MYLYNVKDRPSHIADGGYYYNSIDGTVLGFGTESNITLTDFMERILFLPNDVDIDGNPLTDDEVMEKGLNHINATNEEIIQAKCKLFERQVANHISKSYSKEQREILMRLEVKGNADAIAIGEWVDSLVAELKDKCLRTLNGESVTLTLVENTCKSFLEII